MITHLNYIEDKELRDYIYNTLNKIRKENEANYIAVDDRLWSSSKSRIYYYRLYPTKTGVYWSNNDDFNITQLFYDTPYDIEKIYNVFNNTEAIYDIEEILKNWEKDQQLYLTDEKVKDIKTVMLNKVLTQFDIEVNKPFQNKNTKRFFKINEEADIEIYNNGIWENHPMYKLIDIIDNMYDDAGPVYDFDIDFEEEIKKHKLSPEVIKVIKSILETNYTFMKIYPHENRIVLHMNTDCVPLIINTTKQTIEWFLNFIKTNTSGDKILYISRLKTFWEGYTNELY